MEYEKMAKFVNRYEDSAVENAYGAMVESLFGKALGSAAKREGRKESFYVSKLSKREKMETWVVMSAKPDKANPTAFMGLRNNVLMPIQADSFDFLNDAPLVKFVLESFSKSNVSVWGESKQTYARSSITVYAAMDWQAEEIRLFKVKQGVYSPYTDSEWKHVTPEQFAEVLGNLWLAFYNRAANGNAPELNRAIPNTSQDAMDTWVERNPITYAYLESVQSREITRASEKIAKSSAQ